MSVDTARGSQAGSSPEADQRFFARQLSDLDFNDRLLDLVADAELPLLERVKFLILFSERIDEFFQVQVAGLRRQVVAGIKSLALNGATPDQLLTDVRDSLERMVRRQEALLVDEVSPALRAEGIEVTTSNDHALLAHGTSSARVGDVAFAAGVPVHELVAESESLEEVFLDLTSGEASS